MDLSLTTDLVESFLNDWGAEESKIEPSSVGRRTARDDSINIKSDTNDKPVNLEGEISHMDNENSCQGDKNNSLVNNGYPNSSQQLNSFLSTLIDSNNNFALQQNQETVSQSLPSFWPILSNLNQSNRVNGANETANANGSSLNDVNTGPNPLNPQTHYQQWNQQECSAKLNANTPPKQKQVTNNQNSSDKKSIKSKVVSQIQSNSSENVSKQSQHVSQNTLSNGSISNIDDSWQSKLKRAQQQFEEAVSLQQQQLQVQQQVQCNQNLIHPMYPIATNTSERKPDNQMRTKIYENASHAVKIVQLSRQENDTVASSKSVTANLKKSNFSNIQKSNSEQSLNSRKDVSFSQPQSHQSLQQTEANDGVSGSNSWSSKVKGQGNRSSTNTTFSMGSAQTEQLSQGQQQAMIYQSTARAIMKAQQQQHQLKNNLVTCKKNEAGNNVASKPISNRPTGKPQSTTNNVFLSSTTQNPANIQSQHQLPPFHLFGAPCELRYNFIQSRKQHDLPIWKDNNSLHYGMAVNGFHPQLNAMDNPPVLIDGRHTGGKLGNKGTDAAQRASSCKERNEKEQRRAQKITELIEKLRISMVEGGWKVEMKSKYHTLSTCKDYVKHLVKTTLEKEQALEQAKADLENRQRTRQEDKALSESRSDPESVMSSLTTSSRYTSSSSDDKCFHSKKANSTDRKRKQMFDDGKKRKVHRDYTGKNDMDASSVDSSEEENSGNVISFHNKKNAQKVPSTNSGKKKKSMESSKELTPSSKTDKKSNTEYYSNPDASPDVYGSFNFSDENNDVTCISDLTKLVPENLHLDYEEVFMTSNVPQLIATSAGRIIKYNNFFLRTVGLSEQELRSLTLFSIVQADQLSNLFETLGSALREVSTDSTATTLASTKSASQSSKATSELAEETSQESFIIDSSSKKPLSKSTINDQSTKENSSFDDTLNNNYGTLLRDKVATKSSSLTKTNFSLLTLPCIRFPSNDKSDDLSEEEKASNKCYMTISLLNDENPQKCYFHCLLSNYSGEKNRAGYITPESFDQISKEMNSDVSTETSSEKPKVISF